jgi:hypothetical protein
LGGAKQVERLTFLDLKWPKLNEKYNNQPAIDDCDSVEVEEVVCGGYSKRGEVIPLF